MYFSFLVMLTVPASFTHLSEHLFRTRMHNNLYAFACKILYFRGRQNKAITLGSLVGSKKFLNNSDAT